MNCALRRPFFSFPPFDDRGFLQAPPLRDFDPQIRGSSWITPLSLSDSPKMRRHLYRYVHFPPGIPASLSLTYLTSFFFVEGVREHFPPPRGTFLTHPRSSLLPIPVPTHFGLRFTKLSSVFLVLFSPSARRLIRIFIMAPFLPP